MRSEVLACVGNECTMRGVFQISCKEHWCWLRRQQHTNGPNPPRGSVASEMNQVTRTAKTKPTFPISLPPLPQPPNPPPHSPRHYILPVPPHPPSLSATMLPVLYCIGFGLVWAGIYNPPPPPHPTRPPHLLVAVGAQDLQVAYNQSNVIKNVVKTKTAKPR